MTTPTIGIVGTGRIASYMVQGWVGAGIDPATITCSPRGRATAARLGRDCGVRVAESNADAVDFARVVVLAVPPAAAVETLGQLSFRAAQRVVSVCAGVPLDQLAQAARPADVALAMPTSAATIGMSPIPLLNADETVEEIFSVLGAAIPVATPEEFEVATVSAALYGWVLELIGRSAAWSFRRGLPPETARALSAEAFAAAGRMVADLPGRPVHEIAREVATRGGITELGLEHLGTTGVFEAWAEAERLVLERIRED